MSRSMPPRPKSARSRYRRSLSMSGHPQHERDGGGEAVPGFRLSRELLLTRAGELVVLGAPIVVGGAPFGADPSASLEAMEGGVERPLRDLQRGARDLLNALGDRPSMLRAE